jgi:hypothetical protein
MQTTRSCLLCVCVFLIYTGGCPFMGLEYEDDLAGDYAVWATDTIEDTAIVRRVKDTSGALVVVPCMVFAYGWNDDFIIAKQHPRYPNERYKINRGTTHWYIVEVKTGRVHGPLTADEFAKSRTELSAPSSLSFTKTIQ